MQEREIYFRGTLADRISIPDVEEFPKKKKKKNKEKKDTQPSIGYSKLKEKYERNGKIFRCKYAATGTCIEKDENGKVIIEQSCPLYFRCTVGCNRWERGNICKKCPCKEGHEEYEKEIKILSILIREKVYIEDNIDTFTEEDHTWAQNRIIEIDIELNNSPHYNIPHFFK